MNEERTTREERTQRHRAQEAVLIRAVESTSEMFTRGAREAFAECIAHCEARGGIGQAVAGELRNLEKRWKATGGIR